MSDYAITFRWIRTIQDRDWPKTKPSRRAIMAVAFIIGRYCDKDGSNIECSLNTITHKAGISRRTVIEVLDLLVKESLLQRDGKARGGVIRYRMILGGSEQRLKSTSIPTALCQKDENSITTNDAVRGSLTLAHTADKKTTPPDNFTTIATSTITPSPPQAHDPELLENDIRTIYANRHVRDAIRKGEFTDEATLRAKYADDKDARNFIVDEFRLFTNEVIEQISFNGFFSAFASDECIVFFDGCGEFLQLHWRQVRDARRQKLDYVDDATDESFALLTVSDLLELIDDYFSLAALVVCARYQNHHPQLKRERCKTEAELYYEGDELGLTLDEELITLETFNRDINQYRDKYHRTKQHA